MSDQIHIRDAETAQLLREAARQTGRSMTEVLREAVRGYVPRRSPPPTPVDIQRLLAEDRAQLVDDSWTIEDLYDEDGLPR
jgi:hypothetical protein